MKIIDLLVKIAKREEVPKKIKYDDKIYYSKKDNVDLHTYQTDGNTTTRILSLIIDNEYLNLNDEVEILEEPKKIEKLELVRGSDLSDLTNKDVVLSRNALVELCRTLNNMNNKINELIEEINKLKEK